MFLTVKLLYLSYKNWTKYPLMMLKVLRWPLIMSPSDQFMAAIGVLFATFQFLLLAQVGTKNRRVLTLFMEYAELSCIFKVDRLQIIYVSNCICYLGCIVSWCCRN